MGHLFITGPSGNDTRSPQNKDFFGSVFALLVLGGRSKFELRIESRGLVLASTKPPSTNEDKWNEKKNDDVARSTHWTTLLVLGQSFCLAARSLRLFGYLSENVLVLLEKIFE